MVETHYYTFTAGLSRGRWENGGEDVPPPRKVGMASPCYTPGDTKARVLNTWERRVGG